MPAEAPEVYHCCAFGQSLTELLSTGHLMAFHGSVHEGSIIIPSDVTGGQDILNSLSCVKKLMEKKVILLIGKLSFISVFGKVSWLLEEQSGIWACSVLYQTKKEVRNFTKSFILKLRTTNIISIINRFVAFLYQEFMFLLTFSVVFFKNSHYYHPLQLQVEDDNINCSSIFSLYLCQCGTN